VSAAFEAPVLTTVPRHRKLKRNKPFSELPPEIAEAFRMLQATCALRREAGHERAGHVLAQPRGQDHDRLEPSLAGGFGRPVGGDRRGGHAPASIATATGSSRTRGSRGPERQVPIADAVQAVATVGEGRRERLHAPDDVLVAGDPPANPSALMQRT